MAARKTFIIILFAGALLLPGTLQHAHGLDASLGPRAKEDPDFEPLYEDEEFQGITIE